MKVEKIKHCRIAKATILALSQKARMITKKVTESVKRRPKEYRVKKMQCRIRTRTTEKNEPEKGWNESQRLLFDSRGGA
jgi:hypothetical protein